MRKKNIDIVNRIINALGITKSALAKKFGVSKAAINSWCIHGIPSEYCSAIEILLKETSDPLTRVDMRPDDWEKWWPDLATQESAKSEEAA